MKDDSVYDFPLFGKVHASETEKFLTNKSLRDSSVLIGAMQSLDREIKPDSRPPDGSQAYRKRLTQTLLYKVHFIYIILKGYMCINFVLKHEYLPVSQTILWILGPDSNNRVRSGGKNIKRNVTRGQQTYETDKSTWPINQPILKVESFPQVSGKNETSNSLLVISD